MRKQRYPHPRNVYRTPWGTWYVQVQIKGERISHGGCLTMEEAVEVRDAYLAHANQPAPGPIGRADG